MNSLVLKRHTLIANKLLVALSGVSRLTKRDNTYYYEQHAMGIAKNFLNIKWTKSLIKQVLAYMAKCDSQGRVALMSEEELAATIDCSVRTVQNNNKTLEEHDIIQWDRLWGEYIQVSFIGYLENCLDLHKKNQEELPMDATASIESVLDKYTSKSGYTSVSDEVIYELLKVENINMLRIALRALYAYESQVNVKQDTEALLSYTEVKYVLPSYIGYKAAIKNMVNKLQSIFHVSVLEKDDCVKALFEEKQPRKSVLEKIKDGFILSFNLVGPFNSKRQKELERVQAERLFGEFKSFFKQFGQFSIKQTDIHALAHEFGADLLERTIRSSTEFLKESFLHEDPSSFRKLVHEMESNLFMYMKKIANGYYQAKINAL